VESIYFNKQSIVNIKMTNVVKEDQ
jgi:hypothetical protein